MTERASRRGILGLGVGLAGVGAGIVGNEEFEARLEAFNREYAAFYRLYHGCPLTAQDVAECSPAREQFDRKRFGRAREAAARLFQLREV